MPAGAGCATRAMPSAAFEESRGVSCSCASCRPLERLQKRNQRALVVVAQARLFREVLRSEIVALVDDEVLALADARACRPRGRRGRRAKSLCALSSAFARFNSVSMFFLCSSRSAGGQLGAEQIHVRDEADRHALRERADLHGVAAAANERKQPPRHADERPRGNRGCSLRARRGSCRR